jgi:hypothetical protein
MTLSEINRQYGHWATVPSPAFALARIGVALGLEPPQASPVNPGAFQASSEAEMRAMAAQCGVTVPAVREGE